MTGVMMNQRWGASENFHSNGWVDHGQSRTRSGVHQRIPIVMAGVVMNKEWGASDISTVRAGVIMNKKWGTSENLRSNGWCNHELKSGVVGV